MNDNADEPIHQDRVDDERAALKVLLTDTAQAKRVLVDAGDIILFTGPRRRFAEWLTDRARRGEPATRKKFSSWLFKQDIKKKLVAEGEKEYAAISFLEAEPDDLELRLNNLRVKVDTKTIAAVIREVLELVKAGSVYRREAQDTVHRIVKDFQAGRLDDDEKRAEALVQIQSIIQSAGEVVQVTRTYGMTDLGNAELFTDIYGERCKYVSQWRAWIVWDGARWKRDETGRANLLAHEAVKYRMADVAKLLDDDDKRTKYYKWIATSQSRNKIDNMLALAAPMLSVSANDLDADSWLLNCENGTLDLKTGNFRPHRRGDLLTKLAPVNYDADAECPKWLGFLARIFDGDKELIDYVRRAAGYTTTGDIGEQCFFLLYGTGRNGKSTLVDTLGHVMGDYKRIGPEALLMADRFKGSNRADEAELRGARLVSISEPSAGARLNDGKIKQILNPVISAMRKYGNPEEFNATHKVWLDTNHKPKTSVTDEGFWRRVKLIPFVVQIPHADRVTNYDRVLFNEEASGVLNWLIAGLKDWREHGLGQPKAVTDAVNEYRQDSDTLGQFLAEHTRDNDAGRVSKNDIYSVYKSWAMDNGLDHPLTKIALGKALQERGYTKGGQGGHYWTGLELLNIHADDSEAEKEAESSSWDDFG